MKMLDIPLMRGFLRQSRNQGHNAVQFPISDIEQIVDEMEAGRQAVVEAGDVLEYTRAVLTDVRQHLGKTARIRVDRAVAKIDALLAVPEAEKVDPEEEARKAARARLILPGNIQ